jgi:hypothetical protein
VSSYGPFACEINIWIYKYMELHCLSVIAGVSNSGDELMQVAARRFDELNVGDHTMYRFMRSLPAPPFNTATYIGDCQTVAARCSRHAAQPARYGGYGQPARISAEDVSITIP